MPRRSDFIDHVVDLMGAFGPVEARRMFGGWGLYHRELFFALVLEEVLYLKTDAMNVAAFEAAGLEPFVYRGRRGEVAFQYRRAPDEALESPHAMAQWARLAYAAAVRARARKPAAKKVKARGA